jgi:hypothetical protein
MLFLHRFWFDDLVETVDCGDTAAQWLSKYMLNQDCGVRLGYHLTDTIPQRVAVKKLTQCYKTLRNSDLVNGTIVLSFYAEEKSHLRLDVIVLLFSTEFFKRVVVVKCYQFNVPTFPFNMMLNRH